VLNEIDLMANELKTALTDFLINHSRIDPPRVYGSEEFLCFSPDGDRSFAYLDEAGCKLQASLLESYGRFRSVVEPLLQDQPEELLSKMSKLHNIMVRTIEHRLTWCQNTKQALERAVGALDGQLELVKGIAEAKSRNR
jgi:hypothetical protein